MNVLCISRYVSALRYVTNARFSEKFRHGFFISNVSPQRTTQMFVKDSKVSFSNECFSATGDYFFRFIDSTINVTKMSSGKSLSIVFRSCITSVVPIKDLNLAIFSKTQVFFVDLNDSFELGYLDAQQMQLECSGIDDSTSVIGFKFIANTEFMFKINGNGTARAVRISQNGRKLLFEPSSIYIPFRIEFGSNFKNVHVFGCKSSCQTILFNADTKEWNAKNNGNFRLYGAYDGVLMFSAEQNQSVEIKFITIENYIKNGKHAAHLILKGDWISKYANIRDDRPFFCYGEYILKNLGEKVLAMRENEIRLVATGERDADNMLSRTNGRFVLRRIIRPEVPEFQDVEIHVENIKKTQNLMLFTFKYNEIFKNIPLDMKKIIFDYVSIEANK
jgi:hypothetical protein